MSELKMASSVREAIPYKMWEIVKTPQGLGMVQFYLLKKGEVKLVVSLHKDRGYNGGGFWKLVELDLQTIERCNSEEE